MFEPSWHLVYVRAESRTLRYFTPCLCSSEAENPALLYSLFMFERSREPCATWHHVYVRAESRTLPYLFTFERSREPYPTWHLVYVRAESRTFFMFEPFWHHVYVRAESRTLRYFTPVYVRAESRTLRYFTPCLCSSLPDTMFTFERSRELFVRQAESRTFLTPCSCSSGVENPALLVYVRAFLTPCLRSSGVENPTLLDSLFSFERSREPSWHHVYVRAKSRTLCYLFMFEPS